MQKNGSNSNEGDSSSNPFKKKPAAEHLFFQEGWAFWKSI
jgi:hypothetical protein